MSPEDERIIQEQFFQGQMATTLMRLGLQVRFNSYVSCLLLNKVAEGTPNPDTFKRAILDAWHDTELNNIEAQIKELQAAAREQGIIPMGDAELANPFFSILRPIYAEICERLKIPAENPDAEA